MWCKNCNKEIFSKKCDVCGSTALEHAPFDIYWCDHCKTPVIKQANAPDRAMCPLCGKKHGIYVQICDLFFLRNAC